MRIACAQYSPQVGDIDNNLTRADAVLHKAKPEQLEDLDLLVLPELAFTGELAPSDIHLRVDETKKAGHDEQGRLMIARVVTAISQLLYDLSSVWGPFPLTLRLLGFNFRSLQQIYPFLEPSGSGISPLWARTTALKYNTNVLVGYPEKVDVRDKWPTSPEYYNAAIMVSDDGETVFNYRKNFLDRVDQHWALESEEGFLECDMPGLGKVCVALGVDLNPDAPWHAFDFAFHALEVEADVLIVCMSWLTRKEPRDFSRTLGEPDMETLTYWVQRLEPLVRAELERETIVVFCNRSGQEDDALYAGTSAVIGIREGEVSVYGLAGRGTKEFLIVDTSIPPFAKLVQDDDEDDEDENTGEMVEYAGISSRLEGVDPSKWTVDPTKWPTPPSRVTAPSYNTVSSTGPGVNSAASGSRTQPADFALPEKKEKPSPKLHIPKHKTNGNSAQPRPAEKESPTTIPTPTGPSPTPMAMRPKLVIPEQTVITAGFGRRPSPFPHDNYFLEQHRFFGNRVQNQIFTPITPMEEVPQVSAQASTRFYWKPSDTLLKTPANMNFSFADTPAPDSPTAPGGVALDALTPFPGEEPPPVTARPGKQGSLSSTDTRSTRRPSTSLNQSVTLSPYEAALSPQPESAKSPTVGGPRPDSRSTQRDPPPPRPSNPVSRNRDKTREKDKTITDSVRQDSSAKRSEHPSPPKRTASAAENRGPWAEHPLRTDSPKARHASRTQNIRSETVSEQRLQNASRPLQSHPTPTGTSSVRPTSRTGHGAQGELRRPESRTTARETAGSVVRHARSRSAGDIDRNPVGSNVTKTPGQRSTSRSPPEGKRPVSRGRQRLPTGQSPPGDERNGASTTQDPKDTMLITRRVSVTRIHSSSRPSGVRKATPEDDIVAVEEYVDPTCEQHFQRAAPASAPQHKLPSIADGRAIVGAHCNLPPPPPISQIEEDDDDERAHTPAVLGGSVKTTVIMVPASTPLDSIASALPSATSLTWSTSETSQAIAVTGRPTPDKSHHPNQTPRPVVATRLVSYERRVDTPIPTVCETCGSPRVSTHSDEEAKRPMTNLW